MLEWIRDAWRTMTLLEVFIVFVVAGIISAILYNAKHRVDGDSACLNAGYTQARVVEGVVYCIRQQDGTDQVIRLDRVSP